MLTRIDLVYPIQLMHKRDTITKSKGDANSFFACLPSALINAVNLHLPPPLPPSSCRPWDISRQTSLTSLDFGEDIMRYLEYTESPDLMTESAEDFRLRDDVLASPLMLPKQWSTLDDDFDVADSDDSFSKLSEGRLGLKRRKKIGLREGIQHSLLSSCSITSGIPN
ncbi:hypothetical protein PoB_004207100 [Plakobranchus ocellatus]|uniref:Uncharacterized protein n=1 Tax=Plakobranchus ocellatus TaxID=259542 RepID=A0AAV4AWT3_9GAST|nr:hypothetical protein PoB_004207100 [Plakobranchus ocellatus]